MESLPYVALHQPGKGFKTGWWSGSPDLEHLPISAVPIFPAVGGSGQFQAARKVPGAVRKLTSPTSWLHPAHQALCPPPVRRPHLSACLRFGDGGPDQPSTLRTAPSLDPGSTCTSVQQVSSNSWFSSLGFSSSKTSEPTWPPGRDTLLFKPAQLTESEQTAPWRELQRSSRSAPCLQAGLPLNRPRQSPPRAGRFAPSAPSSRVKFCADSVERHRW